MGHGVGLAEGMVGGTTAGMEAEANAPPVGEGGSIQGCLGAGGWWMKATSPTGSRTNDGDRHHG